MSSLAILTVIMAVYLIMIYVMYREWMPSIWGLMLMAFLIMAIFSIMRPGVLGKNEWFAFMGQGAARTAPTIMSFILAGVFARAQVDTGIVENIIKRAAELGGERRFVVALLLGFASAYVSIGAFAGGIIVAHLIAFPILVSMGLSPITAAVIQSFGACQAVMWWAPHWSYLTGLTKVTFAQTAPFILVYQPFVTATWVAFVIYQFKVNKLPLRWSVPRESLTKVEKKVPLYSLLCPLLPLFFIFVLKTPDHFAFIMSAVITLIATHPGSKRKASEYPGLFTRVYLNGMFDMCYVTAILIAVGFILRANDFPPIKTALGDSLTAVLPSSAIPFILFFGIFMAVGGLFRGPAQPWAMGAAVFASIAALGKYPALLPGALIVTFNINTIVADVTTAYTVYIASLAKLSIIDILKKQYLWCLLYGVIGLVIITIYYSMW